MGEPGAAGAEIGAARGRDEQAVTMLAMVVRVLAGRPETQR
ncbi:hypothetical protein OG921_17825 [Aldersonia sp. NBC_00410]|nr:hypothetical protein [Aldersonia sp. NBC_00410]MCX5045028.1 hypothetical protein [Aldersonia sp. NBC_00410]